MRPRAFAFACAGVALSCGSTPPPPQPFAEILIVVDTDYRITSDATTQIDQIVFTVSPAGGTTPQTSTRMVTSPADLPVTLGVVSSGRTSAIDVGVQANRSGGSVTDRRAFGVPFVPGEVRVLRMDLLLGCVDAAAQSLCPTGASCGQTGCEPAAPVPVDSTSTARMTCIGQPLGCTGFISIEDSGSGVGRVTSSPAGLDCSPTCIHRFTPPSLMLTATPDPGSTFEYWTGDCTAAGTSPGCTLMADQDRVAGAFFMGGAPMDGWDLPTGGNTDPVGDAAYDVAVDSVGDVVVAGGFTTAIAYSPASTSMSSGQMDGFVVKYRMGMQSAAWAFPVVAMSHQVATAVAIGPGDDVAVAGDYEDHPGCGSLPVLPNVGVRDIFVLRFQAADGACVRAFSMGSTGNDTVGDVAVAPDGSVYVTGQLGNDAALIDASGNPLPVLTNGATPFYGFLARLDPDLHATWAYAFNTMGGSSGNGLAVDPSDASVYVIGSFSGTVTLNGRVGSMPITNQGALDAFVAHYGADGTLGAVAGFGGPFVDTGQAIAFDPTTSDVVATGLYRGTMQVIVFDMGTGVPVSLTAPTNGGVYVIRLSGSSLAPVWAREFGGSTTAPSDGPEVPTGIATDPNGGVLVTGKMHSAFVDVPNPAIPILVNHDNTNSSDDVFVFKLEGSTQTDVAFVWARSFGSAGGAGLDNDFGAAIAVSSSYAAGTAGQSWVVGGFIGTITFVPGSTPYTSDAVGGTLVTTPYVAHFGP